MITPAFVFTIFMIVLTMNMLGLVLALGNLGHQDWAFTPTAQLAVTVTLALITFLSVVVIGFIKNGPRFFTLFVPKGLPWYLLILMLDLMLLLVMLLILLM